MAEYTVHVSSPVHPTMTVCGKERHRVVAVVGFAELVDPLVACRECVIKAEKMHAGLNAWLESR